MKKSNKVFLTAIDREDLEMLRQWRNIEDYKKHFREYREISVSMQAKWFEKIVNDDPNTIMFAIRHIEDNRLLGCCGLCYINWVQRFGELSLYIGDKESYIDSEGLAIESCELLFDYGFNQLGLHKIWAEIYSFDSKKIELFQHFKMNNDGVLRHNYFYDGQWWDSLIYSLLDNEYRGEKYE